MRRLAYGLLACCAGIVLALVACSGESRPRGAGEPLLVREGQFFPGDLPGAAPIDAGDDGGAATPTGLGVTAVTLASQFVVPGGDKVVTGRTSGAASSVGVRFADLGTGYWVVPIAEPDPNFPGQLTFAFHADFNAIDPAGTHPLRFTAFDGAGNAGQQFDAPLCVLGRVPDSLHECDPSSPVPAVVFSLQWDADFDLDLHVVTPDGLDINPKTQQLGVVLDAGQPPPGTPKIDRDSLGGCVPDSLRQEDLAFTSYPPTGNYDVYVDPFDPCGKPAVRFTLTIYEAASDGTLQSTFSRSGELLSSQATGGGATGLFVFEKQFN